MVVWRKIPLQNETITFKHDLNFSHHRLLNPDPVSALAHIRKKHIEDQAMRTHKLGNDSNLLIVFYVQIMPDDLVMQLHRF